MKERPILFSEQRVRALLADRQRQTRRIMKSQLPGPAQDNHEGCYGIDVLHNQQQGNRVTGMENLSFHCPFGQPGDRLWVRETWRGPLVSPTEVAHYQRQPAAFENSAYCQYRADSGDWDGEPDNQHSGWQAGIHMPRWASRITLQITGVRVEKVQAISEQDIEAEGVQYTSHFLNSFFAAQTPGVAPQDTWRRAWATQYGDTSWEVNPWVWVIDFQRL